MNNENIQKLLLLWISYALAFAVATATLYGLVIKLVSTPEDLSLLSRSLPVVLNLFVRLPSWALIAVISAVLIWAAWRLWPSILIVDRMERIQSNIEEIHENLSSLRTGIQDNNIQVDALRSEWQRWEAFHILLQQQISDLSKRQELVDMIEQRIQQMYAEFQREFDNRVSEVEMALSIRTTMTGQ